MHLITDVLLWPSLRTDVPSTRTRRVYVYTTYRLRFTHLLAVITFADSNTVVLPEATAGMNDEVADGVLSLFFLEQRVVAAEQFHCQSVVGNLEHGTKLIAEKWRHQCFVACHLCR